MCVRIGQETASLMSAESEEKQWIGREDVR